MCRPDFAYAWLDRLLRCAYTARADCTIWKRVNCMLPDADLTPKARQTRERILHSAIRLFREQGFERTSMRDIAQDAGCSLGLAYRYFSQKEDFVMALYESLSAELLARIETQPPDSMAERFHLAMTQVFAVIGPHRAALATLFGVGLQPDSQVGLFGEQGDALRYQMQATFSRLIEGSTDRPNKPEMTQSLSLLLYTLHLVLILAWLYDRTPQQRASLALLDFSREALKIVRPLMIMPLMSQSITRLAQILSQIFGVQSSPPQD